MKIGFVVVVAVLLSFPKKVNAQDSATVVTKEEVSELKGTVDGVNETLLEMRTTLDALKKIKLSGYIQSQYQIAESEGISSFSGSNFPGGVRDRFQLRRGRVKINYDNDLSQYVLQIDVTQNGLLLREYAADTTVEYIQQVTAAPLQIATDIKKISN